MSTEIIKMETELKLKTDLLNSKLELIDDIYSECDEIIDTNDIDIDDLSYLISQYNNLGFENCNETYTKIFELIMEDVANQTIKIKDEILNLISPYLGKLNNENN